MRDEPRAAVSRCSASPVPRRRAASVQPGSDPQYNYMSHRGARICRRPSAGRNADRQDGVLPNVAWPIPGFPGFGWGRRDGLGRYNGICPRASPQGSACFGGTLGGHHYSHTCLDHWRCAQPPRVWESEPMPPHRAKCWVPLEMGLAIASCSFRQVAPDRVAHGLARAVRDPRTCAMRCVLINTTEPLPPRAPGCSRRTALSPICSGARACWGDITHGCDSTPGLGRPTSEVRQLPSLPSGLESPRGATHPSSPVTASQPLVSPAARSIIIHHRDGTGPMYGRHPLHLSASSPSAPGH